MNFLYFLAYIFKKNMTFAASADKSETIINWFKK